jgi:hypothetical protein
MLRFSHKDVTKNVDQNRINELHLKSSNFYNPFDDLKALKA